MGAAALLLGILLAVIVATRPATAKVLFSATLKIVIALLCSIFAAYLVFTVMHVPSVSSYLIGQVFGCVIIILICVALGNAIRKRKGRQKRHSESN
jgi:hypothetical protein